MPDCFPPVVGRDPKVLILGTMPGRVSLAKGQYYAHPQNQFWRLLGEALREDLAALPYADRLEAVKRRGVALWEVYASCEREGSLDADISEPEPAAVPDLLRRTGIRAVFCNGATAWKAYQAHFQESAPGGTEAFGLPSSSPAHAGKTFEEKLASWAKIALYLSLALAPLPLRAQEPAASTAPIAAAPAAEPSLRDLVDLANKALRGDSSHGRLTMTIVTPSWTRALDLEAWNRGREQAFIVIHGPPKDKGNVTLRRKNEMWLWLQKVERVIKVPATMMHSAWQGSDFTYEDIVKADSVVRDYDHALVAKKQEGGHSVYDIRCDPKPDAPVVWGRVMLKIGLFESEGKREVVPLREEDYNERGELVRTLTLSDVKRLGGRLVPAKLECVPARKPGQRTTIEYHALEFDLPLGDDFFSLARLQKGGR